MLPLYELLNQLSYESQASHCQHVHKLLVYFNYFSAPGKIIMASPGHRHAGYRRLMGYFANLKKVAIPTT